MKKRKWLILKDFFFCFFDRQSSQSTVYQGLAGQTQGIPTKLSTEILDFWQIPCEIKYLRPELNMGMNMRPRS